jgi:hypothetical protein
MLKWSIEETEIKVRFHANRDTAGKTRTSSREDKPI